MTAKTSPLGPARSVSKSLMVLLAVAAVVAASVILRAHQADALPLSISISGNHFVDQNGNTVQLRGIDRSGTQYACVEGWGIFDGPYDGTSISEIKAWGVNAVRVNGNEDCWLGINGVNPSYSGANYQSAIGNYIASLNAQGMYVIFDMHWNAPGTTLATGQQAMADEDHAGAYWTSVANYFKDNHAVLFDIYNESHPDSNQDSTAAWTCVRDGGTCPGVSFPAAGSQELVNDIRATGATNPILIGGPQYAGDVDQWSAYKPNDPDSQLAASIHIYYNTPSSPEWAPCDYLSCWTNTMAPLAQTTPVVIGELGEHDCSDDLIDGTGLTPTQPSLLDWADQHGISYLAWSWIANGGSNCSTEPSLITQYSGTPTNYGIGIQQHYLALTHPSPSPSPSTTASTSPSASPTPTPTPSPGTTAPTTSISCNGTTCSGSWYNAPVSVTLSATGGSGTTTTYYTTDGSTPTTSSTMYLGPFTVSSTATVKFFSADSAGNTETVKSQQIQIDTTPPTTTISCNGTTCSSSWYSKAVTATLSATDSADGVSMTFYTTDGSNPQTSSTATLYAGPFTVSQTTTVKYYSIDNAGNTGSVQSQTVQIDAAAPTVSITSPPGGSSFAQGAKVTVTVSAIDNGTGSGAPSGIASVTFYLDGTAKLATVATSPYTFSWNTSKIAKGTHKLAAVATDKAGNSATSAAITVSIK